MKIKYGCGDDILHISRISIDYTQSPDSCTSDIQTLTLTTDDAGAGVFYRMDTNGIPFAFDDTKDISKIIDDFKNRIK